MAKRIRKSYHDPYSEGVRCIRCNRNIKFEELLLYTYMNARGNIKCLECGTTVRRRARVSGSSNATTPKRREYEASLKRY